MADKKVISLTTDGDGLVGIYTNAKVLHQAINNLINSLGYENPDQVSYSSVLKAKNQGYCSIESKLSESNNIYLTIGVFSLNDQFN